MYSSCSLSCTRATFPIVLNPCWHLSLHIEQKTCRKTYANTTVLLLLSKLYSCTHHRCTRRTLHLYFLADRYNETRPTFPTVLDPCWHLSLPNGQNTCRKHRKTLLYSSCYRCCAHAPITAVLDKPYTCTCLHNPKFADKYRKTVMCSSCCLRCTRVPLTAVLDPAGACPFPKNHKTCGEHRETLLCSSC